MLQYDYVKDILERRDPFRAGHIEGAKKMAALGKIVLAGAYTDPTDGASFCFKDVTRYGTGATILSTKMDTATPPSPHRAAPAMRFPFDTVHAAASVLTSTSNRYINAQGGSRKLREGRSLRDERARIELQNSGMECR